MPSKVLSLFSDDRHIKHDNTTPLHCNAPPPYSRDSPAGFLK